MFGLPIRRGRHEETMAGKYASLGAYLESQDAASLSLTTPDIERIIGSSLPVSARRHVAWWANDTTHVQAAAWVAAGWLTAGVDLRAQTVCFVRHVVPPAGTLVRAATFQYTGDPEGAPLCAPPLHVTGPLVVRDVNAAWAGVNYTQYVVNGWPVVRETIVPC